MASEIDTVTVDLSSISMTPGMGIPETALAHTAETRLQEVGVHENDISSSNPNERETTQIIDDEVARVVPLGISGIQDYEEETKYDDTFLGVHVSAPPTTVDPVDDLPFTIETESVSRKESNESLSSQEDIPDTSLISVKGDQVTEVGWALLLLVLIFIYIYIFFPLLGNPFWQIGTTNL